jgi:hypothetical protein
MKLSEAQHRILKDYVDQSMKPPGACAVCRSNKWECSTEVFKLTAFQEGSGVTALPLCVLICGDCGNTLLIDARRVVGLDLDG